MVVDDRIFVYFEAARPNNTNEIRLLTFESSQVACSRGR